ncbi:MAG: Lrp/AsnC ligand binding domain-containing protein [Paludibacteraceae bacterium]|nr:Lrp/AsnC ligand binding domain-containing protein [Paludibacteraceae bacterium]
MSEPIIDELDRKIIQMIAQDARIPFLEVARACNVSGAAIHQRIQRMQKLGVIRGTQFIFDPRALGYQACAFVGISLSDPARYAKAEEILKNIPEVVECHYTTGEYDIMVKIYAFNNQELHKIIREKIQPIGLSKLETIISFDSFINRSLSINEMEEEDD